MRRLALVAVLGATGCSVILMDKPPDKVEQAYPQCDDSAAAPLVDVGLAFLGGLIAAEQHGELTDDDGISDEGGQAVASVAGIALLHTISAGLGFYWQSKCTARRGEWERRNVRFERPSATHPTTGPVGPPRPTPRGGDGQRCYPNRTCNDGFTCDVARFVCLPAPAAP